MRLRSQINEPDYIIVVDATLMRGFNCLSGLKDNGIVLINQRQGMESPKVNARQKLYLVPANEIALKTIGRPLGNTALLGAYAAATGDISLDNLIDAVKQRFSGKIQDANIEAVRQGYDFIKNSKK